MHANLFDRYHHTEGPLHRLEARVKVVLTVAFIVSNALLPDGAWTAFGLGWLLVLAANALSLLGLGFTLKRSLIALPFALAAISSIFSTPGNPLSSFPFLGMELIVTDAGLLRFASILVRSWLSVQAAILLVAVTTFPDLIHALEHLRAPKIITTVIAFLYRYLFVLSDEVIRLLRARQARSATLPPSVSPHFPRKWGERKRGVVWRAKVAGNMVGQLFLRSYERSDRIYNAMLARGYQGQIRTLHPHTLTRRDWTIGALTVLLILSLQLIGR
ncbi:MAG: energy-coupling factor transporter transmembrane protein EcfT [Chloroflexi bacterium]|nr:energy-coupling factor transporter transmembrane protein EcfT [Chloroflexota bacterium]